MRAMNELDRLAPGAGEVYRNTLESYRDDRMAPAERRVVTVLFCDVVGSTRMAEILDPEEWADLMNDAFSKIISPIERYEGTVTRLIGDAVMAIFGAPHAHADDPQRAILAGLEIIEAVGDLSQRIQRIHGFEFNVRVGINTGLAVVGAFGSEGLTEYTAMGDVTNVADRIQHLAASGAVEVGELTYRLAERYFDFKPLGVHEVRGKSESENTYRVLGKKVAAPTSRGDLGREMPLIGRDREIEQIRDAIDGLLRDGRSRIIAIYGEPGIGKSRLAREAIDYARSASQDSDLLDVAIFENQISPYDAARPYSALQGRIQKVFGIDPDDPAPVVKEKFAKRSQQFPAEFRDRAARVIQRVMSIRVEGSHDPVDFEQGQFKFELSTVLKQIVRGWNPGGAFMLVGEDYQWSDHASMDALCDVYDVVREIPAIFLCTFRPEPGTKIMQSFEALRERFADYLVEIPVGPLSQSDASDLLLEVIEGDTIAAESVRLLIQSRAEGNPLFIEELLTALAEQGAIESHGEGAQRWRPVTGANFTDLSLPTSLGALLLERIDRLDPDAKRTLEQAAVLGRTFSRRVLNEILGTYGYGAFEDRIEALIEAGIIRRADEPSADGLEFRHSMIQEAAYETILMRHRREFHRRAAESMEQVYGDRECEFASAIGYHFREAGDKRAIKWFMRAANHARTVFEPAAAVEFATKAISAASADELAPPAKALIARGHAREELGDYDEARADIQDALDIARQTADREVEWQALLDLGALWAESDYSRSTPLLEEALEVARELKDDHKVGHSLNRLGNLYINVGKPADARDAHEKARRIFERTGDQEGLAETLDLLALANYLMADFISSASIYREAVALFRELGDDRGLASSLAILAMSGGDTDHETAPSEPGVPARMIDMARESLDIVQRVGWRSGEAAGHMILGTVAAHHGMIADGIASLRQGKALAEEIGHRQWSIGTATTLAAIATDLLQWDEAFELVSTAHTKAFELGSMYWTFSARSHLVDLHILRSELDDAERLLEASPTGDMLMNCLGSRKIAYRSGKLALAREDWQSALAIGDRLAATMPGRDLGLAVPGLALLRGQALTGLGRSDEANSDLLAGVRQAEMAGNHLILWKLHLARFDALRRDGRRALAEEALDSALSAFDYIDGQLEGDPWQSVFHERSEDLIVRVRAGSDWLTL